MARSPRGPTGPHPGRGDQARRQAGNIPTADAQELRRPRRRSQRTVRSRARSDARPAAGLEGQGRAGRGRPRRRRPADLHPGEDRPAGADREPAPRPQPPARTEPELTLFETSTASSELDTVDFYRHDANWSNRMILGDSLQVMASLAEREDLRGKVQMIYIDPPYGIKFGSNWQVSTRKRDVKDGKLEDATREAEQIKAFRDTWELGIHSYLSYLRDRLIVARDLLTETGSRLRPDRRRERPPRPSAPGRGLRRENFVSQIALRRRRAVSTADSRRRWYDYILWYAQDQRLKSVSIGQLRSSQDDRGAVRRWSSCRWVETSDATTAGEQQTLTPLPDGARPFEHGDTLVRRSDSRDLRFRSTSRARRYEPRVKSHWKTTSSGMKRLARCWPNRIQRGRNACVRPLPRRFPALSAINNSGRTL